ncbi:hypothetical protein ACM46_03440 [Chryseobacterium angstadtii]|uniref:Uncharacterized protein n=1 Tax=Chryseobacterium angstadtii TaxID=558151 RepID=A0A0J7IL31_9FLAO|nr:hypothetical protein [Chryseobacterium angstadtii]KMQ66589.1 hypothetical protein ACM46_03440 [Chryseobacterium angstadtii]
MKKIIIHSIPILVSFVGLVVFCDTFNPIILRGPEFLKFYFTLTIGFYLSILCLRFFRENLSNISFYFMILIFLLGVVKLFRGLSLDRPVGILFSMLVAQIIVNMIFISIESKHKIKQ